MEKQEWRAKRRAGRSAAIEKIRDQEQDKELEDLKREDPVAYKQLMKVGLFDIYLIYTILYDYVLIYYIFVNLTYTVILCTMQYDVNVLFLMSLRNVLLRSGKRRKRASRQVSRAWFEP